MGSPGSVAEGPADACWIPAIVVSSPGREVNAGLEGSGNRRDSV